MAMHEIGSAVSTQQLPYRNRFIQPKRPVMGPSKPTFDKIFRFVCEEFSVSQERIESKRRLSHIVQARHVLMYLVRTDCSSTTFSFPNIGKLVGGRDHSTVVHAVKKIKKKLTEDAVLQAHINRIRARYQEFDGGS